MTGPAFRLRSPQYMARISYKYNALWTVAFSYQSRSCVKWYGRLSDSHFFPASLSKTVSQNDLYAILSEDSTDTRYEEEMTANFGRWTTYWCHLRSRRDAWVKNRQSRMDD